MPVGPGEYPLDREYLIGLGEHCAPALGEVKADIVKPYLVGPGGFLDEDGHVARAYGTDALILVRPDGHIGLVADGDGKRWQVPPLPLKAFGPPERAKASPGGTYAS